MRVLLLTRPVVQHGELMGDFPRCDVGNARAAEREVHREMPLIETIGQRAQPGLAILQKVVACVIERDVLGVDFAEHFLGQDGPSKVSVA